MVGLPTKEVALTVDTSVQKDGLSTIQADNRLVKMGALDGGMLACLLVHKFHTCVKMGVHLSFPFSPALARREMLR